MASMMEVDTPTPTGAPQMQEKTLKIHPLAIIGISDHQTRVSMGGSAQPPNSPIVGLLFGYQHGEIVSIIDAEEVGYPKSGGAGAAAARDDHQSDIRIKIELHQKVFPKHEVVGWYRVDVTNSDGGDILPTEQDLIVNNGWMKEYSESPLFLLMDASTNKDEDENKKDAAANNRGEDARDKLDRDEQLPLSIYETMMVEADGNTGSVFVNLELELETFEPERIAVEKVFQTQPSVVPASMPANTNDAKPAAETTTDVAEKSEQTAEPQQFSAAELQLESLITSIEAMNTRVAILLDFLHKTQSGEIPPDYGLLRQVGSLVKQLPLMSRSHLLTGNQDREASASVATEFENEYDDMLVMSFIAAIAKTTKAVLGYSEKFRIITEAPSRKAI
jgi:hypothetical protein